MSCVKLLAKGIKCVLDFVSERVYLICVITLHSFSQLIQFQFNILAITGRDLFLQLT